MSEWDKEKAKYWEEQYENSEARNGCLLIVIAILALAFISKL